MIVSKIKYFRGDKELEIVKTTKGIKMNIELEKNKEDIEKLLTIIVQNIHFSETLYFSKTIENAYFTHPQTKQYIEHSYNELNKSPEYSKLENAIKSELSVLIRIVKKNPEIF